MMNQDKLPLLRLTPFWQLFDQQEVVGVKRSAQCNTSFSVVFYSVKAFRVKLSNSFDKKPFNRAVLVLDQSMLGSKAPVVNKGFVKRDLCRDVFSHGCLGIRFRYCLNSCQLLIAKSCWTFHDTQAALMTSRIIEYCAIAAILRFPHSVSQYQITDNENPCTTQTKQKKKQSSENAVERNHPVLILYMIREYESKLRKVWEGPVQFSIFPYASKPSASFLPGHQSKKKRSALLEVEETCHKSIGTGKKYKTCLSSGVTDWNVVFFFLPVPPIMKMINREKRETDRIKWSLHRRELLG
ncbi:hypothetical protein RRG08_046867 [Elysia crispata]|uniref:Uncharacterized protein n=1 Tax=Elysia crispata TaxID=231223 RepID=A0AAE0ZI47_9GAST|nr:hypothetical protein RRG08_046867 [Elysia crispata]